MGDKERPSKLRKVVQNHEVQITSINTANMDHFCNIVINPDFMNPEGSIKRGIRINVNEFPKGAKVLGERCGYRLLTPLSTFSYACYLHKATEDFLKNGTDHGPAKPILQVFNQSPFRYKSRSFVAAKTSVGMRVFELFANRDLKEGFAEEVDANNLPFIINWSGPYVQGMDVDDKKVQVAVIQMIKAFETLQPNIQGLGLCVLAEFGRFLLYNVLVDGDDSNLQGEEIVDDDQGEFKGFKQMLIVLQSGEVETGKSFLSDVLLRIFYGGKHSKHSTLSFDSAKSILGKGEPVVIDDYNNDGIGSVLLSRSSKAIWGKAQITIKGQSVTPAANLLLCTNEDITSLKVEGKNKEEVYSKLSVIDLGEEPMKSNTENKGEIFKEVNDLAKVLRNYFPSFLGLMLQTNSVYITSEEFKDYEYVTKHERLANLINNIRNLYDKIKRFCNEENIVKPKSLESELDYSCITNKSELAFKLKSPDQIVDMLLKNNQEIALTEHESQKGVVFDFSSLTKFPWFDKSFCMKKDGMSIFTKMRTRQLSLLKYTQKACFLRFDFLKEVTIEKINDYIESNDNSSSENEPDLVESLEKIFDVECCEHARRKKDRVLLADKCVRDLNVEKQKLLLVDEFVRDEDENLYNCVSCGFTAKSKGGLTRHIKTCKKKPVT